MRAGEYLRILREKKDMSLRQVSIKSGVSHTQIADVEKGNNYGTREKLEMILSALRLTEKEKTKFFELQNLEKTPEEIKYRLEKLIKENEELKKNIHIGENCNLSRKSLFNVFGKGNGGNNGIDLETAIRQESIVSYLDGGVLENGFLIEISGNSMYPTLIEGDLVVIDPIYDEFKDDKLYVITYNGETYIKRVFARKDYIQLLSDNKDRVKYPDIIVMKKDEMDFVCNGVVIEAKRKFRK